MGLQYLLVFGVGLFTDVLGLVQLLHYFGHSLLIVQVQVLFSLPPSGTDTRGSTQASHLLVTPDPSQLESLSQSSSSLSLVKDSEVRTSKTLTQSNQCWSYFFTQLSKTLVRG